MRAVTGLVPASWAVTTPSGTRTGCEDDIGEEGIMNITDLSAEQRRLRVAMVDETGQDEPVLKPEQLAMGIRER